MSHINSICQLLNPSVNDGKANEGRAKSLLRSVVFMLVGVWKAADSSLPMSAFAYNYAYAVE